MPRLRQLAFDFNSLAAELERRESGQKPTFTLAR